MKLSDGRKVAMHKVPECEPRSRLHSETSKLLADWLLCKDEVKLIRKNDPQYAARVEEMKSARTKFKAAANKFPQHTLSHGC